MRMSSIYCSNNLFIFLLILLTNSINVESKCQTFDYQSIGETDEKLLGRWNLLYSNFGDDLLNSFTFLKKFGNILEFQQKTIDGRQETGVIRDINQKGKLLRTSSFESSFWILDSDFNNYLMIYQCVIPVSLSNYNQENEFYRILSRTNVISDSDLFRLMAKLEQISPQIRLIEIKPIIPMVNRVRASEGLGPSFNRYYQPLPKFELARTNLIELKTQPLSVPVRGYLIPGRNIELDKIRLEPLTPIKLDKINETVGQTQNLGYKLDPAYLNIQNTGVRNTLVPEPVKLYPNVVQTGAQLSAGIPINNERQPSGYQTGYPSGDRPNILTNNIPLGKIGQNGEAFADVVPYFIRRSTEPKMFDYNDNYFRRKTIGNVKTCNGKQIQSDEECLTEGSQQQFIAGCSLEDCPLVSYLRLTHEDFDKLEGSWFLQYSTEPIDFEYNLEIEKTESNTPVLKRYVVIRNGTEMKSLGFTELIESRGFMKMHIMTWNGACNIPQTEFYNIILSTDFTSYFIGLKVAPNIIWEQQVWTRVKYPLPSLIQPIVDEVYGLAVRNNLNVPLEPINQNITQKVIAAEQLTCRDLKDKGIADINLRRLRGNWRSILLNVDGVKCLAMKNRIQDYYDYDSNEFSFDVFTERGNVGVGQIRSNGQSLTHYSSVLQTERNITILDTDYMNYFIYYECNIFVIKGEPIKIVEYGLMARKPTVCERIMTNARQVFNQNGLANVREVDQNTCHFKKQPPVVRFKYCDSVANYSVSNLDLDLLRGSWWLRYSTINNLSDIWTEWKRNPDFTSDYTHIFKQINDDRVLKMLARLDQPTGYLMVKLIGSGDQPEIPFKFLSVSKDNYILYLCDDMGIQTPNLEKLGIYSKQCEIDGLLKNRASEVALSVGLFDQMRKIDQFNCEQDHKYMTKLLSKKCIKFHDSELVEPKFSLLAGQWNRHLMSRPLPYNFDYALIVPRKDELDCTVFPDQIQSTKTLQNGTNLINTITRTRYHTVSGNEAVISVNYSSYILKYSCVQYEENNQFNVIELLMLSLRPEVSSQLSQRPNLFFDIINEIPEKTLAKLQPLIGQLTDHTNILYEDFGRKTTELVEQRLDKFRIDNKLSHRTDKEMFEFLRQKSDHFDDDEQIFFHISTITSSNFTLDMTNFVDESLPFDRISVNKESPFSYELSFFYGDRLMARSDRYYDKNSRTFWGYTEGRRSIKTYLFANSDYRVVYTCEEYGLTAKRILRLFSAENTKKPRDWYSYQQILMSNLKPKTLAKIADLIEELFPIGRRDVPFEYLKDTFNTFTNQIGSFQQVLRGKPISLQPDDVVNKFLIDNCKTFESDEVIDPNLFKLNGIWNIDWTNSLSENPTTNQGLYFIDIIEHNSDAFAFNTYLDTSGRLPPQEVSRINFFPIKNRRLFQRSSDGLTRGLMTIVWTDYDNYLIGFDCTEKEVNGVLAVNEYLTFYSRNGTKNPIDLEKYFDLIVKQLHQKTILKLYYPMSTILPSNPNIINQNIKPITEHLSKQNLTETQFDERTRFIKDIYFEFLPKGLINEKINKYVRGQAYRPVNDSKLFDKVKKVCHRFNDNELKGSAKNAKQCHGTWSVDYETRNKFNNKFDSFDIFTPLKSNAYNWKFFLKNELVSIKDNVVYNKWYENDQFNGQRELNVPLLVDDNHIVSYMCEEVIFNGVPTGREYLHFASRNTNKTGLDEYFNKLTDSLDPKTLSKVTDLFTNVRPIEKIDNQIPDIKNERNDRLSENVLIENILQKHCKYFSPKDTVEPNFRQLLGTYSLRLATNNDFYKPYDKIEWIDGDDRFFSELRHGTKFQARGKLTRISDTNQFEEEVHKRRTIQTILYTDYSDLFVCYSCKENVHNIHRPVIENLKLFVRNNSNKIFYDIMDFKNLMFTKLSPNVYQSISGLIPNLKYFYNATNTMFVHLKPEEECPILDNFAQKDINFKLLTGQWNAIFTSSKHLDNYCITHYNTYDESTDSLIQTRIGQKHKIVIKHSEINGKQKLIVDNNQFNSWILATDHKTFVLSYACHIKIVNGIKKKNDVLRLYTKTIEAIDFDKQLLETLRKKSQLIGKHLEPINRLSCLSRKLPFGWPARFGPVIPSIIPAKVDQVQSSDIRLPEIIGKTVPVCKNV